MCSIVETHPLTPPTPTSCFDVQNFFPLIARGSTHLDRVGFNRMGKSMGAEDELPDEMWEVSEEDGSRLAPSAERNWHL